MSDTPRTDAVVDRRQTWQGMREQEVTDFARELEREITDLKAWKNEALTVESWWKKIDDFVRAHPDAMLGRHVSAMALEWLKERDDLKAQVAGLDNGYYIPPNSALMSQEDYQALLKDRETLRATYAMI